MMEHTWITETYALDVGPFSIRLVPNDICVYVYIWFICVVSIWLSVGGSGGFCRLAGSVEG